MKRVLLSAIILLVPLNAICQQDIVQNANKAVEENIKPNKSPQAHSIKGSVEVKRVLSLKDCLEIALQKSPLIIAAKKNSIAYEARIGQAKAAYFPELEIRSGASKFNQVTNNVTRFMDRNMKNYSLVDASVTQQIYDFGKTRANVNLQKASYEYTVHNLENTIDTVVYQVKEAYYYLLFTLHQYNLATDMVVQFEKHLEQANAFYEIGTKPKLDVTIARVNLKDARLNLIKAENDVKIATASLNNSMGMSFIKPYNVKDELKFQKLEIDFDKAYDLAKAHRPALKMAENKIKVANEGVKLAKKSFMPKLEGKAGVARGGSDFNEDEGWNLGVFLKMPVTNAYKTKKEVDEAVALYDKEMADAEKIKQDVYFEVQKSYYNFLEASKRIPVAKEGVVQAQESFDLANGRYKVGLGDPIELKDAEITYQNSKLEYYSSLFKYNKAISEFERVVGSSLDKVVRETI